MKLEEAKQILKEHNYIVEWGYDHYCNPYNQMNMKRIRARAELKNELIDELIANTDYTEEDRKSLFELDVRKLKKLLKDNGIIIESTNNNNTFTVDEICSIIADNLDTINLEDRCYPVEHFKVYLRGKKISFDTGKRISFAVTKITINQILNDINGLSDEKAKDYLKNVAKEIYKHNSYTKEMLRIWSRPSYLNNRY